MSVVGYPTVVVMYRYEYSDETYTGEDERAFLTKNSAESYWNQLSVGSEIAIRIDPRNADTSFLRD